MPARASPFRLAFTRAPVIAGFQRLIKIRETHTAAKAWSQRMHFAFWIRHFKFKRSIQDRILLLVANTERTILSADRVSDREEWP